MFIIGLGTALPPRRFTQSEIWSAFQVSPQFSQLNPRSRALLEKVLTGNSGIDTRHFAVNRLEDGFDLTPDALHSRFATHAPVLATQAAERALADAGTAASEIDAVLISTCTGYLCPGLTSYVSERLDLRSDVLALDLVGQGCGAALPNLRNAEALLRSGRCRRVLCVCVEVCSAAVFLDNDPGVLISACLFADGAGAAVVADQPNGSGRRAEWTCASSILSPTERDLLRFEQKGGLLRNLLTPSVPKLAARHAATVLDEVLAQTGLTRDRISTWIWHAGGRDVLRALRQRMGMSEADLGWSASILRDLGNVSSPFVLFALQRALVHPAPGGFWWLSAFGAGFSCHGALLKVD
jgi:alkylresorcinol/alkylpyrone synthase